MATSKFWQRIVAVLAIPAFRLPSRSVFARASPLKAKDMVYDWDSITPSPSIAWTPCFDNFTCTRLEVPLDYANPNLGTTAIAFTKLSAHENPDSAENLLLNQGGPGGSGVGLLLSYPSELTQLVGTQYNLIGFDPRGVNNSGPVVNCFPDRSDARAAFESSFFADVSNASSTSTETQYYASEFFGKWCTEAIRNQDGKGQYVSSPAVAQDMLSYIKAEQNATGKNEADAKLWYYGVSYGTALGATFASLFPDHVGRLILDGVLDAEDYYNNGWRSNLFDADAVMNSFSTFCHQSGPDNCSFWGPSAQNITDRLDNILAELKYNPIPVLGFEAGSTPGLATYSDLKQTMLLATYAPLRGFPLLSDILLALEHGNGSAVVIDSEWVLGPDVNTLVKCVDGYGRTNFTTLDDFEDYVRFLEGQSKYFGEVWPNNADGVLCRSLDLDLPKNGSFPGPLPPSSNMTAFPILFVSNSIDPVAPIRGARKMSKAFPGSVLLTQDAVGHTASASASTCLIKHFQLYLAGQVPPVNTTCQPDAVPFMSPGIVSIFT